MKIVYFDYASIVILIVVVLTFFIRKLLYGNENKNLFAFITELFITIIVGCICLNLDNYTTGYHKLKFIFHGLYLLFHALTATFYLVYIMSLSGSIFKIYENKLSIFLIFMPALASMILIFCNIFTHHLYWITEDGVYTKSKLIYLNYLFSIISLCYGLYITIFYKKAFSQKSYFSIVALFPFTLISMIIENFFPNIVIEPFGNTIAVLLIMLTIERPEELLDFKTGLFNRKCFEEDFTKAVINKKESQHIFVNFINYRSLKNTIGYDSDYKLSVHIADIIKKICKEEKLKADIYYLKKGQFRIVIDKKDYKKVERVANLINDTFQKSTYVDDIELNYFANVCIVKVPQEINTFESLTIFGKDISQQKYYSGSVLYAKDIFKTDYYQKIERIDKIIEKGFSNNAYTVFYQPIYSEKEKKYKVAEALIRLNDEKYGFIPPEVLIPAAEASGAIHKIDSFVFEQVCQFISSPEFANTGIDYVAVNISATHCMQDNIYSQLESIFEKYNVDPDRIRIEISEIAFSKAQQKILDNLTILKNNNISLSIDNFGKGYSNIHNLAMLPVNNVKIDKTLCDSINNKKMEKIITKLIEIIKELDLKCIVHGIETPEAFSYFKKLNCDYLQGFFFSKPLPKDKFLQFIKEKNFVNQEKN